MIGKLNHVAIAVPNVKNAAEQYKNVLGVKISDVLELPNHGVKTIFIELDNNIDGDKYADTPIRELILINFLRFIKLNVFNSIML